MLEGRKDGRGGKARSSETSAFRWGNMWDRGGGAWERKASEESFMVIEVKVTTLKGTTGGDKV